MPASSELDNLDSGDHFTTFVSQFAAAGLAMSAAAVMYTWPFHKPGTNRFAMLARYSVKLVPLLAGVGAVHSTIMTTARDNGSPLITSHAMAGCASGALMGGVTFVSINGAIGGCMLLAGTSAAGALYKHARAVPLATQHDRAETLDGKALSDRV